MSKDALSPRETEVLALAWQCMDTEPKIDFDKLAKLAGYGSRNSASVTFGNIKRKLKAHIDTNNTGKTITPTGTPKKPVATKAPRSGKRGAAGSVDDESPSKKKKSAKKPTHREDDDDEEFKDVRVKAEETSDLLQSAADYYNQGYAYNGGYHGYSGYSEGL